MTGLVEVDVLPPDKGACTSCPYRKNVPSGVWAALEYLRLPDYDRPYEAQPRPAFLCHRQTRKLCAGWIGTHGGNRLLAIAFLWMTRSIDKATWKALLAYQPDPRIELFKSGREACDHGLRDIEAPSPEALAVVASVLAKPDPLATRTYG